MKSAAAEVAVKPFDAHDLTANLAKDANNAKYGKPRILCALCVPCG
jgi:hypothetical protein